MDKVRVSVMDMVSVRDINVRDMVSDRVMVRQAGVRALLCWYYYNWHYLLHACFFRGNLILAVGKIRELKQVRKSGTTNHCTHGCL